MPWDASCSVTVTLPCSEPSGPSSAPIFSSAAMVRPPTARLRLGRKTPSRHAGLPRRSAARRLAQEAVERGRSGEDLGDSFGALPGEEIVGRAARLAHQHEPRADVPRIDAALPEALVAAGRGVGEAERRRAESRIFGARRDQVPDRAEMAID